MTRNQKRKQQEAFLEQFRLLGNMLAASRACGTPVRTVQQWCRDDQDFTREFQDARFEAALVLDLEARRRALDGFDHRALTLEPEPQSPLEAPRLRVVRRVESRLYSDSLLKFLLREHLDEINGHGQFAPAAPYVPVIAEYLPRYDPNAAEFDERVERALALLDAHESGQPLPPAA